MSVLSRCLQHTLRLRAATPHIHPARPLSTTAAAMASEFKLKGLTSLDLKNGQLQEVEVEGIEEGKVLLSKVQDRVHATGAKCTHYGAPLSKGVLGPDGRLTCPWHGACFNLHSGDVEDAPALDPIARFDVVERDGAVYVRGDEATIKAGRRTLGIKCQVQARERVVIVGGGSGATGAIEGLRSEGFKGEITCLTAEPFTPIDRTKLSKALMADASKVEWRSADFYKSGAIDMKTGTTVESVDFGAKKVAASDGQSYSYDKLILASGGQARMLPLEGLKGDLENVFPLRTISDVQAIVKAAGDDGGKKVVVIGSSFIGMEAGNALAGKKHDVTIVGMEKEPMERVMGEKVGAIFRKLLEKSGVKFRMEASVEKGTAKSGSQSIGAVVLKDGTQLEADVVVEGVGIRPATDYLKDNSAVSLEKDGSVAVDASFAVKGLDGVYAIGDIATYPYHGPGGHGQPVRIEHWNVAQNAGRSVARQIARPGAAKAKPFIPVFWSAVGAQLRYCGHTPDGFDDVVVQGETDVSDGKQSFAAYYAKGDTVVAVATMAKDPYMVQSAELMRSGRMPSKSELQKGQDIMQISLPAELKI